MREDKLPGSLSLAPYFVDLLRRIDPKADPLVFAAAGQAVRAAESGNVCLALSAFRLHEDGVQFFNDVDLEFLAPFTDEFGGGTNAAALGHMLLASKVVGKPGEKKPLILDQAGRLYLYRYWQYEEVLAGHLHSRAREMVKIEEYEKVRPLVDALFPDVGEDGPDWQKIAAVTAFLKKICVICGGPGTGKTSTVVKLMALLVHASGTGEFAVGLAAPTGKAAARLQASIQNAKRTIKVGAEVLNAIPEDVKTIHRLLGFRRNSVSFKHNKNNPLNLDVLIVDEASMVDLALMAKLFDALPDRCQVVLLGDKDQLSSVEAGRVLGDICGKDHNGFSAQFSSLLNDLGVAVPFRRLNREQSPLSDSIVILEKSYRFDDNSGIGSLAKAIKAGMTGDVFSCLAPGSFADICHQEVEKKDYEFKTLIESVCDQFSDFLRCLEPDEAFASFERFRLLCVHRNGSCGSGRLNALIAKKLMQKGMVSGGSPWYAGRPVLITENDYSLQLFNGDTGITMVDGDGELRVFFLGSPGSVRSFSPLRLPSHETAFAVTVHKSQGSEFEHVALLLPKEPSPVLCRDLLYTAVTRARKKFTLWGDKAVLEEGLKRKMQRSSGLADKLYRGENETRNKNYLHLTI